MTTELDDFELNSKDILSTSRNQIYFKDINRYIKTIKQLKRLGHKTLSFSYPTQNLNLTYIKGYPICFYYQSSNKNIFENLTQTLKGI